MKQKVLAIDESKAIRFLLQTVLGKEHEVITASDGYAAMTWLGMKNFPGLIITDPRLPDMKDWELVEFLSSSGLYGHIPIMVLSEMDINDLQQGCRKFNVLQYFQKPFNPVELLKAVNNMPAEPNIKENTLN